MEKEIADILLRGEVPILPPESFRKEADTEPSVNEIEDSTLSKEKIRKIKRKQYFRRQSLKRLKEKAKMRGATPSFDFNAYTSSSFCRKDHQLHIQSLKEKSSDSCLHLEGKSEEELLKIANDQQKQIESLTEENNKLQFAIYRLKKNLNIVSSM